MLTSFLSLLEQLFICNDLFLSLSNNTDLIVIPDILPSTVGIGRFTKIVSVMVYLTPFLKGVVVGLILKFKIPQKGRNASLGFERKTWGLFLERFLILSHNCNSFPTLRMHEYFGMVNISWRFFTRYLPCFTELYRLFYANGFKVIPEDIFHLLTPVALAHRIYCDGGLHDYGLVLCTHSFTIPEIVRLMNVLIIRY